MPQKRYLTFDMFTTNYRNYFNITNRITFTIWHQMIRRIVYSTKFTQGFVRSRFCFHSIGVPSAKILYIPAYIHIPQGWFACAGEDMSFKIHLSELHSNNPERYGYQTSTKHDTLWTVCMNHGMYMVHPQRHSNTQSLRPIDPFMHQ